MVSTQINESLSCEAIDQKLIQAGWVVQDKNRLNLFESLGVAVREMDKATGPADDMLFIDGKACGIIEAKREGASLGGVAEQSGRYAVSQTKHIQRGVADDQPLPFLYEATNQKPTFTDLKTHKNFLNRSIVYPGDVLMNIVRPPLGKVSIVPVTYEEWNINQDIAVYRPINRLSNKLLAYFLLSSPIVLWMQALTKTTAGQVNLTLEICRNIPIPLPSEEEQKEIAQRVEEKLTAADRLMTELNTKITQAQQQTILASAFKGML